MEGIYCLTQTKPFHIPVNILDWTIVISPDHPLLACSPDGLDIDNQLGYEFKTKDGVCIPAKPVNILPCEYLQCQTSLWWCRDWIDGWILFYNRIDTDEHKAFLITLDADLMTNMMMPIMYDFVDRVEGAVADLTIQSIINKSEVPVDFSTVMNKWNYPRAYNGLKDERLNWLNASKKRHVVELPFV